MAEPLRLRYVTPTRSALQGGAVLSIVCSDAGTEAGTVTVGGSAVVALSWTTTLIRVPLPALAAGTYAVVVTTADARTDTLLAAITYRAWADGPTAFDDIETGVLQRLEACGLAVASFSVSDLDDDDRLKLIRMPAVNVAIVDAALSRVTSLRYKAIPTIRVSLALRNLRGEEERRRAMYPLIMGVLSILTEKTLTVTSGAPPTVRDVACKPLVPARVRLIAESQTVSIWQVELRTSTPVPVLSDEDAVNLVKIGMEYYLQPDDDGVADAADEVEIEQ